MKILKKIVAFTLCVGGGLSLAVPAWASGLNDAFVPHFSSVTGLVEEILTFDEASQMLHLITSGGAAVHFIQDGFTYVAGPPVTLGETITIFYDASMPAPAVYPPQHQGLFLLNKPDASVHFRHFSPYEHIDENTPINLQNGRNFREMVNVDILHETLKNRLVAVVKDANQNLLEIVVMFQPHIAQMHGVFVNDVKMDGIKWHQIGGEYFLPFRQVANALGLGDSIIWDNGVITFSNNTPNETITFEINNTQFTQNGTATHLAHAPILKDDTTFVPYSFFLHLFGQDAVQLLIF